MNYRYSNSYGLKKTSRYLLKLVTLVSVATLYACGGGGGSDSPPLPSKKPDTKIQGAVVKGAIKNADVDIYAIRNGSIASKPLQTVHTNSKGAYSFTLAPDYSGPVLVVVHNNSAGTASMTCDYINGCVDGVNNVAFGEDISLGGIELKTYVQQVTGGSAQTVSITPLTLMAAAYLDKSVMVDGQGVYNALGIASANSQIGNLLRINNIVTTTPPDITNSNAANADSNALKYAFLSAAITAIAQQEYNGNIVDAVNALVDSITTTAHEGQLINVESPGSANKVVVSLAELLGPAQTLASQLGYSNNVTSDLDNFYKDASKDANQDTWTTAEPSPTAGLGDLAKVKAFVADLRTWGNVIYDEISANTGTLEQRMQMAEATFNAAGPLLSDAFGYAVTAAFKAYVTNTNIDLSTFSPDPKYPPATGSATLSGSTVTVVGSLQDGAGFNIELAFPAVVSGTEFSFTMNSATVANSQAEIKVTQPGNITISYASTYPQGIDLSAWKQNPDTTEPFPDPDSGSLGLTASINELGVADPVSFEGSMELQMVGSTGGGNRIIRDVTGNVINYNPSSASLSGTLSSGTNSVSANASATMSNADSFMPVGLWYEGIGSYSFSNGGNILTLEANGFTRTYEYIADSLSPGFEHVVITDVYPWGSNTTTTELTYTGMEEFLNSGYGAIRGGFWTWFDSIGAYHIPLPQHSSDWATSGGTLDGILDWGNVSEEDSTHFRALSAVSLSFNAQLDGLPEATFTLTGDRTGLEAADLEINIAYGSRSIHAVGSVGQDSATGTITITNQDGVKLTVDLNGAGQVGSIKYDQTKYATIETVRNIDIIRYIDGHFESL